LTLCPKCGKEMKEGAIKCIHCGSYLNDNEKNSNAKSADLNKLEASQSGGSDSAILQREKYAKYGMIMIVVGFLMYFVIPWIAFLLIGGGIITVLTNINWKSK